MRLLGPDRLLFVKSEDFAVRGDEARGGKTAHTHSQALLCPWVAANVQWRRSCAESVG